MPRSRTRRTPKVRLTYKIPGAADHIFQGDMDCRRCAAPTNRHKQCQRRVCYALPYCAAHTKKLLRVRVCQSDYGSGLSAYEPSAAADKTGRHKQGRPVFAKDKMIVPYSRHVPVKLSVQARNPIYDRDGPAMPAFDGKDRAIAEYITAAELERRYPGDLTGPYADTIEGDHDHAFDAVTVRSVGAMANDARETGRRPNAKFVPVHNRYRKYKDRSEVWLRATRNIYHGDPILVNYSADYWGGIQPSITHDPHYRPRCRRSARVAPRA